MSIIDLSHRITGEMPSYPGTPAPVITLLYTVQGQGFAEHSVTLSTHTGTHIDAPSHMIDNGRSLDSFTLECFAGSGAVLDLSATEGSLITIETLKRMRKEIEGRDFVLLHTGWARYWGTEQYFHGYPVLSVEAAEWLAGLNLKGVGVDMISLDKPESTDYPLHRIFLEKNTILIENLADLYRLIGREFLFCCLPLKIAGAEASPVRAVALL